MYILDNDNLHCWSFTRPKMHLLVMQIGKYKFTSGLSYSFRQSPFIPPRSPKKKKRAKTLTHTTETHTHTHGVISQT